MKRTQYTPNEKAKIVIEILQGDQSIAELSSIHGINPNMLNRWKREALEGLPQVFERSSKKIKQEQSRQQEIDELYKQIGKLTTQNEWLKKNLVSNFTVEERKLLIDYEDAPLSIRQQTQLLDINRSSLYYQPVKPSLQELEYKAAIDRIYTKYPFFGSRRMALALSEEYGYTINRKAVQRHMREMGIEAIYPRQKTSTPNPRHTVYPYLLKGMNIQRPNQVWAIKKQQMYTFKYKSQSLLKIIEFWSRQWGPLYK